VSRLGALLGGREARVEGTPLKFAAFTLVAGVIAVAFRPARLLVGPQHFDARLTSIAIGRLGTIVADRSIGIVDAAPLSDR
jgi:hypothetical protein